MRVVGARWSWLWARVGRNQICVECGHLLLLLALYINGKAPSDLLAAPSSAKKCRGRQKRGRVRKRAHGTCAVVEQERGNTSIEKTADDLINEIVLFAYEDGIGAYFLESFAHGTGLVIKDPASAGIGSLGNC